MKGKDMIERHLGKGVLSSSGENPIVAVTGPRQSGKTTLCRALFPGYAYVSLERPDVRRYAIEDPNGFLGQFSGPVILDEVQHVPSLFSYIMVLSDEHKRMGEFILLGSQNFLLQSSISQSLAGRCATMRLLPFSHCELVGRPCPDFFRLSVQGESDEGSSMFAQVFKGGFPPIYERQISPTKWLSQYTLSYLERDVRFLANIGDLYTFETFLRLCAGRSGQILNLSSLAMDAGVSPVTAKRWLSLLSASYTVFLLFPYQKNFNKRLIKSPKMYFYDSGLLCYLLDIRSPEELSLHSMRGAIFETYIVSELTKAAFNSNIESPLFYWRDSQGHEVDVIIKNGEHLYPIEIKSGQTVSSAMFENLNYWRKLSGTEDAMLIYGGDQYCTRSGIAIRPWNFI